LFDVEASMTIANSADFSSACQEAMVAVLDAIAAPTVTAGLANEVELEN
jgi:hypothetical protein